MERHILIVVAYTPKIYSGLDRYFVSLTGQLVAAGYLPVFVYGETLKYVPAIRQDLEAAGAIVENMPDAGKWKQYVALRRLYIKYKPVVVHTHFVNFLRLLTALMSFLRGIKHFTTIHSMISKYSLDEYVKKKGYIKRMLLGLYFKALCTCSKNVFCVSKNIESDYHRWAYGNSDNAITLYLGIDATPSLHKKSEIRQALNLPQDKILLVNIAAKEHLKGIDLMLKALAELKKSGYDNVMFVHIGGLRQDNKFNRRYEQSLCNLAKELNIENDVVWLGKRADINDILPAFDIYVHPSREEGFGVVLLEASVAKLPLIGAKVGGIPEIISDGENGLLFETENVNLLVKSIIEIIEDDNLRRKFSECAFERVKNIFGLNAQVQKLIGLYGL